MKYLEPDISELSRKFNISLGKIWHLKFFIENSDNILSESFSSGQKLIAVFSYFIDFEVHMGNSQCQIFPLCGILKRNLKMGWLLLWSNFDVTNWSLTNIRPYLGMGYAISGLATMPLTCSLTYMTLRGRLRPETLPKFVEKRLRTTSSRKLFQIFHTWIWL